MRMRTLRRAKNEQGSRDKMSNYLQSLSTESRKRYTDKLRNLGFTNIVSDDPYIGLEKSTKGKTESESKGKWTDDHTRWPKEEFGDIYTYFIDTPGPFTRENLKAYRSSEAYKYYIDGWVQTCQHRSSESGFSIIRAKVMRSQAVSQDEHHSWVAIRERDLTVECGHCTCMAGLGEVCSHVASILFKVEGYHRLYTEESCTSKACSWNQTFTKKVEGVPLSEICFNKPKRGVETSMSVNEHSNKRPKHDPTALLEDLKKCATNAVVFTVLNPVETQIKNDMLLPVLFNLYNEFTSLLSEEQLNELADNEYSLMSSTVEQNFELEKLTRKQSDSGLWHKFRAGRITSSVFHEASNSSLQNPPASLIKKIVYGNRFQTSATKWGKDNEGVALKSYIKFQQPRYSNLTVEPCGLQLSNEYTFLGATPDSIVECNCCGKGSIEIKCPFKFRDEHPCELDDKTFCLEPLDIYVDSVCASGLKYTHPYFSQVQGQMGICELAYSDFVCFTNKGIHVERIYFDLDFFRKMVEKLVLVFRKCVLPELLTLSLLKENN